MRKTIIMGVMLSCFLLLVTPCINAVEYKEVREEVEQQFQNKLINIKSMNFGKNVDSITILIIIYLIISVITFFIHIYIFIAALGLPTDFYLLIYILLTSFVYGLAWPTYIISFILLRISDWLSDIIPNTYKIDDFNNSKSDMI